MKGKKNFFIMKILLLSLLYLAIFLYTITFSTPVSWLVLYFFTTVFLFSFLTTRIFWNTGTFELTETFQRQTNGHLCMKTKGHLPLLVPYLSFTIVVAEKTFSAIVPSLFKTTLTVTYPESRLPRGHHKSLFVRSYGKDLFGFFTHQATVQASTNLKIYPQLLPSKLLSPILDQIHRRLRLKTSLGQNDVSFRQLREHQIQDPLKDIDWKSSFRKQELMVKEYDKETDASLNLYFLGIESPQFEELLDLAYSLYVELAPFQKVQLYLMGEFDHQLMVKQNKEAFLTIHPTARLEPVEHLWEQHTITNSQKIVVAPIEIVSSIKNSGPHPVYFLNEETLATLHIGGK